MRLFGFEISRSRQPSAPALEQRVAELEQQKNFLGGLLGNGWFPIVRESFTGAWQRGRTLRAENLATFHAAYACITRISKDISKLPVYQMQYDEQAQIWTEVKGWSPFNAVLEQPNTYQNRIQFISQWVISKLAHGNTYVLKVRDQRGIVTDLYILDPTRTRPIVTEVGDVYYQLGRDNLSGVMDGAAIVPASEIIHDVNEPLFHPLAGVSPLAASALAITQGMEIQENAARLFRNGAMPSGVLSAPGHIDETTAKRIKAAWEEGFTGENYGRVAVLGDNLKWEAMAFKAVDAQLIEQLKFSGEMVCSTFHVPPYMVGIAAPPANSNIEALGQQYYTQCLQHPIECIELLLTRGLGLTNVPGKTYAIQFDVDALLRMDTPTRIDASTKAVGGAVMKPNEARRKFWNLGPVEGGDQCYLQEQNYSLAALAKRDQQDNPFGAKSQPASAAAPVPPAEPTKAIANDDLDADTAGQLAALEMKSQLGLLAA